MRIKAEGEDVHRGGGYYAMQRRRVNIERFWCLTVCHLQ